MLLGHNDTSNISLSNVLFPTLLECVFLVWSVYSYSHRNGGDLKRNVPCIMSESYDSSSEGVAGLSLITFKSLA